MTSVLYKAILTVSKLQRSDPRPIKLIILTKLIEQHSWLKSATTFGIQSFNDRSTNESIKTGILKLNDSTPRFINVSITQTAAIELVNFSKCVCTIFGFIRSESHPDSIQMSYSTDFDDITTILNISADVFNVFLDEQLQNESDTELVLTPVTKSTETTRSLSPFDLNKNSSPISSSDDQLFDQIQNDFQSFTNNNRSLEIELSKLLLASEAPPPLRNNISRPLIEKWFILILKIALKKMENWTTIIDQPFIIKCKSILYAWNRPQRTNASHALISVFDLNNEEQILTLLDIILGLHTVTERNLIKTDQLHKCSFIIKCPFNCFNEFPFPLEIQRLSIYSYFLNMIALQLYSNYQSHIRKSLITELSEL